MATPRESHVGTDAGQKETETGQAVNATTAGRKDDAGKLRWRLLPVGPLRELVRVFDFGATKYGVWNWSTLDDARERYHDALLRHVMAWAEGELLDPETSIHHLAHAAVNCLFLIWFERA